MPVDPAFRELVEAQLGAVVPDLKLKSMFGGIGIYSGAHFFALIAEATLYFKVDETNRADFDARGLGPFHPYDDPNYVMQYYEVPRDMLEDAATLRQWAAKAIAVAQRKGQSKKPRRK